MSEPCVILLVEDDPNDAFFVSRALKELGFEGKLEHVADTDEARAFLTTRKPAPQIVVSDATLSVRGTGLALLQWMRTQEDLGKIPFVILSGEVSPEIETTAKEAGVQAVLRKGSSYKDTVVALRSALQHLPEPCRPWLRDK